MAGPHLAGGVVCVAGAAAFFRALPELRRAVRPIYVRMGILPDLAPPLESPEAP